MMVAEAVEGGWEIPGQSPKRPGQVENLNTRYPNTPPAPFPLTPPRRISSARSKVLPEVFSIAAKDDEADAYSKFRETG
ncbi:hypothetical protein [Neorhizobium alkalisoli]|uniref:hypothetical protein n=1 Tax=Neorhizobium alkalisoli TaxID=528178 RepID=UPI000CF98AC2|nr:hypothetical protein [Neorhizobium alkalisoli]